MSNIKDLSEENRLLQVKYKTTSMFYDILDYPWERQYKKWRPGLLEDVHGKVLEAGVGTGRNLRFYPQDANVTGIDLSADMLKIATKRGQSAACEFNPIHEDATSMASIPADYCDWLVSTYLCCVMPDHLQPLAITQFERVMKPGARFKILEMIYSKKDSIKRRQLFFAPFTEWVYGARFDRNTLRYIEESPILQIDKTYFLKDDVYLVIEGTCKK